VFSPYGYIKNSLPRSCNQARECVLYTVLAELVSNTDADAKKVSIIKLQMSIFFLGIAENYLILDIAF
jgi:hypothetical protein